MSTLDASQLKVVELRSELAARGLSTAGLKAELAARLTQHLQGVADSDQQESTDAPPRTMQQPADEPSLLGSIDASTINASAVAVEPADAAKADAGMAKPPISSLPEQLSPRPHADASQAVKETAVAESSVERSEAAKHPAVPSSPTAADERQMLTEALQREGDKMDVTVDAKGELHAKSMLAAVHDIHAAGVEAVVPAQISDSQQRAIHSSASAQPDTELKPGTKRRAEDEAMPPSAKSARKQDPVDGNDNGSGDGNGDGNGNGAPLSERIGEARPDTRGPTAAEPVHEVTAEAAAHHPPTRSLYIGHLVRPLVVAQVRSRLEEFGELCDAPSAAPSAEAQEKALEVRYDGLWLDGIKTHAFVTFETLGAAKKAHEALDALPFPEETSRPVVVRFVPTGLVRWFIAQEEQAWNDGKRRLVLYVSAAPAPAAEGSVCDQGGGDGVDVTGVAGFSFTLQPPREEQDKKRKPVGPPPPVPRAERSFAAGAVGFGGGRGRGGVGREGPGRNSEAPASRPVNNGGAWGREARYARDERQCDAYHTATSDRNRGYGGGGRASQGDSYRPEARGSGFSGDRNNRRDWERDGQGGDRDRYQYHERQKDRGFDREREREQGSGGGGRDRKWQRDDYSRRGQASSYDERDRDRKRDREREKRNDRDCDRDLDRSYRHDPRDERDAYRERDRDRQRTRW
ncbi:hypothetical protein ACQY0O_004525 [Thecaphora frezii]